MVRASDPSGLLTLTQIQPITVLFTIPADAIPQVSDALRSGRRLQALAYDRDGALRAVLAEVRNTFGERHDYLIAHADGRPIAAGETIEARKVFHVSPFCEVKGRYAFRFRAAPSRWLARVDLHDDASGTPLIETWISGRAEPLDPAHVRSLLWRYRWFTLGVVARIHWQAAKLWMKRVPFFTKPTPPSSALSR